MPVGRERPRLSTAAKILAARKGTQAESPVHDTGTPGTFTRSRNNFARTSLRSRSSSSSAQVASLGNYATLSGYTPGGDYSSRFELPPYEPSVYIPRPRRSLGDLLDSDTRYSDSGVISPTPLSSYLSSYSNNNSTFYTDDNNLSTDEAASDTSMPNSCKTTATTATTNVASKSATGSVATTSTAPPVTRPSRHASSTAASVTARLTGGSTVSSAAKKGARKNSATSAPTTPKKPSKKSTTTSSSTSRRSSLKVNTSANNSSSGSSPSTSLKRDKSEARKSVIQPPPVAPKPTNRSYSPQTNNGYGSHSVPSSDYITSPPLSFSRPAFATSTSPFNGGGNSLSERLAASGDPNLSSHDQNLSTYISSRLKSYADASAVSGAGVSSPTLLASSPFRNVSI